MTDTTAQIPQPDVDKALPIPPPKLYSPGQITAGVVLGSFLASGFMARANLVALGKETRGNVVLALSAFLTLALVGLAIAVPKVPSPVFVGVQLGVVVSMAKAEFGTVTDKRSSWGVLGYGVASLFVVAAVLVALVFVLPASAFE